MKKGFTLLELIIAIAISSIVAVGIFSVFSSIAGSRDKTVSQSQNIILIETLTRLFNKDARMMLGGSLKVDKTGDRYRLTFRTYNSLRFNKALPVDITYYIDDYNWLVRQEENVDVLFNMEMRIIPNVTDFKAEFYNGTEFREETVGDAKIMNIKITIDNTTSTIPVARTMDNS